MIPSLVRDMLYIDGVLYKPNNQRKDLQEVAIGIRRSTSPDNPNRPPIPNIKHIMSSNSILIEKLSTLTHNTNRLKVN